MQNVCARKSKGYNLRKILYASKKQLPLENIIMKTAFFAAIPTSLNYNHIRWVFIKKR